ncbi:MAG TPA: ABC transporter permease [Chryseolinea sp.]|nr:ABC transporter permease [Chryseolinea sp.]
MNEIEPQPPGVFLKFFRWYCHPKMLDYIEGDLIEVYDRRLQTLGKRKADVKFILDVLLLFRPGIIKPAEGDKNLNHYGMIKSYFTIGWRSLLKNKGLSLINIGGLAMGMAVALLIGLWVYDELSYDKQNPRYDRVAQVLQHVSGNGTKDTWWGMPYPLAEELRSNYGNDFKRIAQAISWGEHIINYNDKAWKEVGMYIEREGPQILGTNIKQGTGDLIDPASILISSTTAEALFGTDDPLNKVIKIDNMPVVKVAGVYHDFPTNSTFSNVKFIASVEFLYNNDGGLKNMDEPWRPNFTYLFVELHENNVDFAGISEKIKYAKQRKLSEHLATQKPELFLHPMRDWHLRSEFRNGVNVGGAIEYVWIFGSIGMFVLLLACINFMNLSTARHEKRAKEVGIRKAIGSIKSQLVVQFLSESFLTVFLAFLVSLIIAQLALPFFNLLADKHLQILWGNPVFWVVSLAFITFTSLVSGSYPAFYLSSFKAVKVLKGTFRAGRFAMIPRQVLVTVQFTVSITLMIGTIIVYQQIKFAANRPIGYSRESLVSITTRNATIHDHLEAVKNELVQSGAAVEIAEAGNAPTYIAYTTSGLEWAGKDPNLFNDFGVSYATHEYGKVIGWHIREGRDFSHEFKSDSSGLILNEAAINYMNLKNPIGQRVTWFGQPYTIIGVVDNMIMESPYQEIRPIIFNLLTSPGDLVMIKLNPGTGASESLIKIENTFKKYNPTHPFEYKFVDEDYGRKFGNEERTGKLVSILSALAIFISCLGLFGLASFVAEQRTKEIGVRKVMGASVFALWKMLSKDFMILVVLSILIASPVAYYFIDSWLLKFQYHTDINWWVFALSGMGALVITLLTVSYQSIKAAVASPVKSLRTE